MSSAVLCCGLIEAIRAGRRTAEANGRLPQCYAAASLKPLGRGWGGSVRETSSAVLCCGLIEAQRIQWGQLADMGSSAVLCCGLIEAERGEGGVVPAPPSSAVLCCGLIEASVKTRPFNASLSLPQCYAAASLKHAFCIQSMSNKPSLPQCYAAASLKLAQNLLP